ncbi:MAG: hypothetical protein ABMA02_07930 [Saprospiraceae bacterium]
MNSLQVLPTDGVPVDDTRHWHSRDAAWADVVRGVGRTLQQLHDERAAAAAARLAAEKADAERRAAEELRARDAADAQQRAEQARTEAENRRKAEAETARQREQAEAEHRAAETNAWQNAQQTGTAEALYAYLNHYPAGNYAREARQRIKQLQGSPSSASRFVAISVATVLFAVLAYVLWPKPPDKPATTDLNEASTAEANAWEAAKNTNTVSAYKAYLSGNSTGAHASEAQKALDNLQTEIRSYLSNALFAVEDTDICLNNLDNALKRDPGNPRIGEIRSMLKDGMIPDAKRALEGLLGK